MDPRRLAWGIVVFLIAAGGCAGTALAQFEPIPCVYLRPPTWFSSGLGLSTPPAEPGPGEEGGGAAARGGAPGGIDVSLDYALFTFDEEDGRDLRDLGIRDFDLEVWSLNLGYKFRVRPRLAGDEIDADATGLGDSQLRDLRRAFLGAHIPYLDADLEDLAGGRQSASGIGDPTIFYYLPTNTWGKAGGNARGLGFDFSTTAPLGDEDEGLGWGDWTAAVSLVWWAEIGRNDLPRETEFTLRVGYDHNFGNEDLSRVMAGAGFFFAWSRASLDTAIVGLWDTGDESSISGGHAHDPMEEYEVSAQASFFLTKNREWSLLAGLLVPLDDDGLTDETSFRVGASYASR